MTCEEARQEILSGKNVEAHTADCPECAEFAKLWLLMGQAEDRDVRPAVSARFHETLQAYEQGLSARPKVWRPIVQIGLAAACLCIGLFAGMQLGGNRSDLAEVRREMTGMRQLVTLSLLQQQSASERLRGVTWANRSEGNDTEVLSALLRTINSDTNENVRLAAIDALRNFSSSSVARRGIVQSLPKQSSPLVQIALIDLLTDLREPEARAQMQTMLAKPDIDLLVRGRIERSLEVIQ